MIINHNLNAMNSFRQMGINNANMAKTTEKLASGLRINRAGDDAAGLAISEKMRGQIRGLDMAAKNSQDGISLIQTAEGALNETHSILQRMRELAVQSANDTNTATDRKELQKEVNQLAEELGRIGNTTEFNTKNLLNGKFDGTFHIGANENQSISLKIDDMRGFALGVTGKATYTETGTYTATGNTADALKKGTYEVKNGEMLDANGTVVAKTADGLTFTMQNADGSAGDDTIVFTHKITDGTITYDGTNVKGTSNVANTGLQAGSYKVVEDSGAPGEFQLQDSGGNIVAYSTDGLTFTDAEGTNVATFTAPLADGDEISVGGIDISDASSANKAITIINNALEAVSAQRSKLGAVQNRLEHTINNLNTASENLTASESRIRDTDMAKTVMENTKNSILAQAAQAMLAQANQAPQQVLQLLR